MARNGKLPKRIAGVKIPKRLRRSGGRVYGLMQNPMIRNVVADLVAAGLVAAADAISRKPAVKKAGKAARNATEDSAEAAAGAAQAGAFTIANILALAAREGARAIKSRA
jgi:hypothetical protein